MTQDNASNPLLSVLVVDDDELLREFMAIAVEQSGCTVETAEGGAEALARLGSHTFDLLITDWQMPEMDGLDLVRRVREGTGAIPYIIMVTARGAERTERAAREAGVDGLLQKPVDFSALERAIASARHALSLRPS